MKRFITTKMIASFGQWLSLGGLSQDSVLSYCSTITTYCRGQSVEKVNDKKFFTMMRERLAREDRRLATISRHTFALKKFILYLREIHDVKLIDLDSIKCKKQRYPPPAYLERSEIAAVRALPIGGRGGLRNRTLFEFLLFTGCRISEALAVDRQSINFERGEVVVIGKGNKQRVVFLGGSVSWISRYLREKRKINDALFLNQYGQRLDRRHATVIIRELGKAAALEKGIYAHMLRATFATHIIRSGVDPRTLQEMLGHDDIETTLKHYVGVSREHMQSIHASFVRALGEI